MKSQILSQAKTLKTYKDEVLKKVFVGPIRPSMQREANRALVDKMKRRRDLGEDVGIVDSELKVFLDKRPT